MISWWVIYLAIGAGMLYPAIDERMIDIAKKSSHFARMLSEKEFFWCMFVMLMLVALLWPLAFLMLLRR